MIHDPFKDGQPKSLLSPAREFVRFGAAWIVAKPDVHPDKHLDLPVIDDSLPRQSSTRF